jgi:hypothetical protein
MDFVQRSVIPQLDSIDFIVVPSLGYPFDIKFLMRVVIDSTSPAVSGLRAC